MAERWSEAEVWARWRTLVAALPLLGLMAEAAFSRASWSQWAADHVSGLARAASTRRVAELTHDAPAREMRRLYTIARLNHLRLESSSRWVAVAFITIPASVALTLSELSPGWVERVNARVDEGMIGSLVIICVVVIYYLLCAWRARRITTALELAFIARDLPVSLDGEGGEPPFEEPMGV